MGPLLQMFSSGTFAKDNKAIQKLLKSDATQYLFILHRTEIPLFSVLLGAATP